MTSKFLASMLILSMALVSEAYPELPEDRPRAADPDSAMGLEMLRIPAGTYQRGSPDAEAGRRGDEVQHTVTISRPFLMGKTQVTQELWQRVIVGNPSRFLGNDLPVERVEWFDAVRFCNRLSEMQGLEPAYRISGSDVIWDAGADGYRLPTEAEWEHACRAGTTTRYHTGDSEADLARAGWYAANSAGKTHPVGRKDPNAWGLHDMHGNVWEWCWDWYGDYPTDQVKDPTGPPTGTGRVLRGGRWADGSRSCRSASRRNSAPGLESPFDGFRLVRSILEGH